MWLLFLQHAAVSAASSAHLLGLSHPAHGLQVHVPGQGEKCADEKGRTMSTVMLTPKVCFIDLGVFFFIGGA